MDNMQGQVQQELVLLVELVVVAGAGMTWEEVGKLEELMEPFKTHRMQ